MLATGACDAAAATNPYSFYSAEGTPINGSLQDGMCIYPLTNCSHARQSSVEAAPCCNVSSWTEQQYRPSDMLGNYGPMVPLALLYLLIPVFIGMAKRRIKAEYAAAVARAEELGEAPPEVPEELKPNEMPSLREACGNGKWRQHLLSLLAALGYILGVALPIQAQIEMNASIQSALTPAQRTSVLAADAFLAPVEEIFEFLEDTVTVRIGYALGAGRYAEANRLLNAGVVLGLLSGCAGGGAASLLASSDAALEAVVYPQGAHDGLAYPNCSLLERPSGVVAQTRPFFLLSAFQWPLAFANKVLLGFGLGCGQLWMWGWPMALRSAALLAIWFGFADSFPEHRLAVLGAARLAGPVLAFVALGGGLLCQSELRAKYGIRPLCWGGMRGERRRHAPRVDGSIAADAPSRAFLGEGEREGGGGNGGDGSRGGSDGVGGGDRGGGDKGGGGGGTLLGMDRDFLLTSLKAMSVDVTQQLALTIGVYVAAYRGVGTSYQIAAMQSAKPSYGAAWIQGFAMALKVMGSKQIAEGTVEGYRAFGFQFLLFSAYTLFVAAIACVAAVVPYARAVSYHWGESACFYATEPGCAPLYRQIFAGGGGGEGGLGASFVVFAFVAAANTSFILLKAGLYATVDFDFMATASIASLVLVFAPALYTSIYAFDASVPSLYIAMYAPHFALVPIFGARLLYNVRRMMRGEPGPWSALNAASALGSGMQGMPQGAAATVDGPGGMGHDPQERARHEGAIRQVQGHPEVLM